MSGDYRDILVRSPNWIGDQILAFPFFHSLRRAFPRARISVVCMPWVASIQYRDLVDEVFVLARPKKQSFLQKAQALEQSISQLKRLGPWDLGISLPNSLSAAWILHRAGCRRRRGYRADFRGWLLNDGLSWNGDSELHRGEAYLGLLAGLLPEGVKPERTAKLFWGVPPENDLDPGIPGVLPGFDPGKAWPRQTGEFLVQPPIGDYWVIAPGAAAESRRWPLERFVALTQRIIADTGWPAVVVGGAAEAELGKALGQLPNVLDRTALGAVSNYWPVFKEARFTVANDSGLAHVAALCGSRVHVVWGAGDPKRTTPLGPAKVTMTFNPVECWPCERNFCRKEGAERLQCLNGMSPEMIWEDIQRGSRRIHGK